MANKKFFVGMLVMALVFGMAVTGCSDGGGSDPLNGTWVTGNKKLVIDNGSFVTTTDSGTNIMKGTYSSSGSTITITPTDFWGSYVDNNTGTLASKWYTKADLKAALPAEYDSQIEQMYTPFTGTVNGNSLTYTYMGETATYTKQ